MWGKSASLRRSLTFDWEKTTESEATMSYDSHGTVPIDRSILCVSVKLCANCCGLGSFVAERCFGATTFDFLATGEVVFFLLTLGCALFFFWLT